MQTAYQATATVLSGRRIEVSTPEFAEGDEVQVFVLKTETPPRNGRKIRHFSLNTTGNLGLWATSSLKMR